MSDSKRTDNEGVAVKTKPDRPPKIISSKSTGEITIKHRKIEKKDTIARDGSTTDRAEKDKDKKEKKEKRKGEKKEKKKRDSIRLSKSLADPNGESKTNTSDDYKESPRTLGTPYPLSNSLSSPGLKTSESLSGNKSSNHSRHSSKDDSSNTNSTPKKSKTPRSPRVDALRESDTDEHTDEDKQTFATLKFKRDQFIRTISSRNVPLPMHVKAVFSETIEDSDSESSSSGMDWEDPNFELQIDKQIKELGEPLPEETALLSNLQSMLKIPTWKNEGWIQTLQEEKDRTEKDKRKSLNTDHVETSTRRSSLGPLSSPSGSRSTLDTPQSARSNRSSSGSKPTMKAKVGYVLLKSKLGPWKRRYLILDDNRLTAKKGPVETKAKLVIPMLFSQCKSIDKPLSGKRKLYMFEIFTPDTKFLMATDNQQSTQDWVTSIQRACDNQMLQSLDLQEGAGGHHGDKEDLKPEVKELLEIMKLPGNNVCTDCDAADPEWAVINIGNFVCIDCSGVHRALGVQVSKVRSIYLDNWEPEAVAYMRTMGNKKVNEIWESKVPSYREKPQKNATREKRMFWIVSKYVKKEFFDWSRASEANVNPENHQSISNTVLAAKMLPSDMVELKKAILNLVKEDESFRKQMKDLIFGDNEMRQALDGAETDRKDKAGRTRATTTTAL
jgi:hypothetical protein